MTNKNILFAFSGRHIGGAELVTTEAVRTAIGAGYKVSAICNSKEVAGLLSNLDIQVKTVDFPKLCGKTEMLTALYRAIYFYYFILLISN